MHSEGPTALMPFWAKYILHDRIGHDMFTSMLCHVCRVTCYVTYHVVTYTVVSCWYRSAAVDTNAI